MNERFKMDHFVELENESFSFKNEKWICYYNCIVVILYYTIKNTLDDLLYSTHFSQFFTFDYINLYILIHLYNTFIYLYNTFI